MRLGNLCEIVRGSSPRPKGDPRFYGGYVPRLMVADVTRDGKYVTPRIDSLTQEGSALSRPMQKGDLVIAVSGNPGLSAILEIDACIHDGFVGLRNLNHARISVDYLYRYLMFFKEQINSKAVGAIFKNLTTLQIADIEIPLPPLEEQRRIAAILDKADAVRRKRQQAIALTEQLLRSAFLEMFGDPITNPKGWEVVAFSQFVQGEMRNGLSPSTSGTYEGQVLTLSAITQGCFNSAERKTAKFDVSPPSNKMVHQSNLLICRGNGNINLVGSARFPNKDYDDVMFPDTIIAVPVNFSIIHKTYLEILWNSSLIRHQIEQQARTTNGTHKINQKVLNNIQILLPPMALQEKFALICNAIKAVGDGFADSTFNNLFNSLLQKAFRGEL